MSHNFINQHFPQFKLQGVTKNDHADFPIFTNKDLLDHWSIICFVPLAFTFVCPTEVVGFNNAFEEFNTAKCQLFACSIDSAFALMEWRKQLGNIRFPILSDVKHELGNTLGICNDDGVHYRATYIIDPQGIIQHISINNLNVGRSVSEILRTLHAFQAGGLRQCDWKVGEAGLA